MGLHNISSKLQDEAGDSGLRVVHILQQDLLSKAGLRAIRSSQELTICTGGSMNHSAPTRSAPVSLIFPVSLIVINLFIAWSIVSSHRLNACSQKGLHAAIEQLRERTKGFTICLTMPRRGG